MEVLNKKWERVYRWLLAYIDENKFSGNLKLPSENALCRDLKVSRDTVRAAMDQLERESLIRRVQGSGTYFNRDVAMSRELDSGRAKVKIGMILQGRKHALKFLHALIVVVEENPGDMTVTGLHQQADQLLRTRHIVDAHSGAL